MSIAVLCVCEKPSQARALQGAINSLPAAQKDAINAFFSKQEGKSVTVDFTVIALHGHIMRAYEPSDYKPEWGKPWSEAVIPMIPDRFQFKVGDTDMETYNRFSDAVRSGKFSYVVNCCDPDREGESIFWLPFSNMGYKVKVLRLYNHDATNEEYQESLARLLDYAPNSDLYRERNASLFRIMFDWEVGMNLSRLVAMRLNLKLSGGAVAIGRVKTPVVSLVVKRDNEIANFSSSKYYEIVADFGDFKARWTMDGQTSVPSQAEADSVVKQSGTQAVVTDVTTTRKKVLPPQMFSLSELQKVANRTLGYSAQKVLDTVQALYEAGLVSYPRTDARVLTLDKASELRPMLQALGGIPELSTAVAGVLKNQKVIDAAVNNKRYFDNQKVTAHHALVNTKNRADLSKLTAEQQAIYLLIVKRFAGIFLPAYEYDETVVTLDMNGQIYKATSKTDKVKGWQELTGSDEEPKDSEDGENTGAFPVLANGDVRIANTVQPVEKKTKAPSAYTDASLISDMTNCARFSTDPNLKAVLKDKGGLGTEATRASLIEECLKKGLLARKGKHIISTPEAKALIASLSGLDLVAPDMTAVWEMKLREVEDGSLSSADFKTAMNDYVHTLCQQVRNLQAIGSVTPSLGACPICGADVKEGSGSFYCSTNKKDVHKCWFCPKDVLGAKLTTGDIRAILAGRMSGRKRFTSAKTGKEFSAQLRLGDDANHRLVFEMQQDNAVGKCPRCGKNVLFTDTRVYCEGHKLKEDGTSECSFFSSTEFCGKQLTKGDFEKLLNGETVGPFDFVSRKTGKPFTASLKINSDGKISYDF